MAKTGLELLQEELERLRSGKAAQAPQPTQENEIVKETEDNLSATDDGKNAGGFWSGLGYVGGELWRGLVRGIEGISDFVVGGAASLFGADDYAEDLMKNDWLDYDHATEKFNPGTGWSIAGSVAGGIGGMLPSIGAAFIPGVGAAVSAATLATGAAGQATSEAVKETGDLSGKEWLYGTASGALEAGIEALSGGIGGTKIGKVAGKTIGKTVAGKAASTVLGEAVEEAASSIADPYLKRATGVDENAQIDWDEVKQSALIGGITGGVMGGASVGVNSMFNKGYNNYAAAQDAQQLAEWKADSNERQANDKKIVYNQKDIADVASNLSKRLQKMSETARTEFLGRNANIAYMFNADGTMAENAVKTAKSKSRAKVSGVPQKASVMGEATADSGNYNRDAYSASLRGYEGKFAYKPISSTSSASTTAKQVMNTLTKLTKGKTNIVLTEDALTTGNGGSANGLYKDGIIYLDANATDYQKALVVGSHEVIHGLEGTKEYELMAKLVAETIDSDPALQGKYNYEVYREAYDSLLGPFGREVTKDYQATTEIFADFIANEVLSDERTLKRLINRDSNIFVKMLEWVRSSIAKLGMSKEERSTRNALLKFEKLLADALEAGRGGISLEEVEKNAVAAEKMHESDAVKERTNAVEDGNVAVAKNATTETESTETKSALAPPPDIKSVDASDISNKKLNEKAKTDGVISVKNDITRYNLFTFKDGGEEVLISNLKKNHFTEKEINNVVGTMRDMSDYFNMLEGDIDGLVDWNSAKVIYDEKTGKSVFTAMVKNGDYPLNIDLSTICKKRKALTKVLNTLVKRNLIDDVNLSAENLVKVNDILRKNGFETACPACFVETKRYRVNEWANQFLDPWNELIEKSVKTPQKLDFANGVYAVNNVSVDTEYLDSVIKEHTKVGSNGKKSYDSIAKMAMTIKNVPEIRGYLQKSDMIGSIGLGKIKQYAPDLYSRILQKGGTSTPKIIQEVQPYNHELGFYKDLAKQASDVGGVRMFSFSDFTVQQTFDYLQVVADLASQKASMQSYYKELTYAELFGLTGIKINLSMIPAIDRSVGKENAGLDKNGKPIYSTEWGVNYDDAKKLMFKEGYNGNVGTATIGVSNNHILKLLDDPVTNYIIPYHKSSINPIIAQMMDIDMYTDYTNVQSTRYNGGENAGKNIKATEAKKFNFFKSLAETKDARKMAEKYLEWCKENNYIPKFNEFAWHPNYYKLLVDFQTYKTVDGKEVYAPQDPVQMKLPDDFKDILKAELSKQQATEIEQGVKFEPAMKEIVNVLSQGRASIDVQEYANQDILNTMKDAGFDTRNLNEQGRSYYNSLKAGGVENLQKNMEYLNAVRRERLVTAKRMVKEAAEDAGYDSPLLYHGTTSFGFTQIKTSGVEDGAEWSPFFATNNPNVATTYSNAWGERRIGKVKKSVPQKTYDQLWNRTVSYLSNGSGEAGEVTKKNWKSIVKKHGDQMTAEQVEKLSSGNFEGFFATNDSGVHLVPLEEGFTWSDYIREGNYGLYASTKNLLEVQGNGAQWDNIDSKYGKTTREIALEAKKLGYSGVKVKDIIDKASGTHEMLEGKKGRDFVSDVYIFFEPQSQVKSADPVTYDDNGDIIPLTERFKETNTDIRYSLKTTDSLTKTSERIQSVVSDEKVSVKERWDNILKELKLGERRRWIEVQISLVDEQAGIVQAGKNLGLDLNGEIQRARSAKAAALNMLTYKQTDFAGNEVGESLRDIFAPIQRKGEQYAKNFNEYLLHNLNVDRMSLESKGIEGAENKPVFEQSVTAKDSQQRIAELDAQHPQFKEIAEKVWKYCQNLLQYRVDAGLITQEQADQMSKMYPHYVPAFYDTMQVAKSGASVGKSSVAIRTGVKAAKGSSGKADLIDVSLSISRQTESAVRAASINKIVTKLYDKAVATDTFIDLEVADQEKLKDADVDYDEKFAKDNQIVFYKDGERITLNISEYMYAGFEGLGAYNKQLNSPIENATAGAINAFKKLVTSWNPLFAVSNMIRDAGDALYHTRYGSIKYAYRYLQSAFRFASKKNSKYRKLWDAYVSMGGFQSGYYKGDLGVYDDRSDFRKKASKFTKALETVNDYIEQIPRFAEFVASVKAGNSYEKALYDSADVTTNFSRGGKLTKKLNRTWIPFLNPAVQGWSKLYRTWVDPMDKLSEKQINEMSKTAKGRAIISKYGQLVVKTLIFGIGVGLLNDLLFKDDEDYKNIPLNVKENFYLLKNGKKFIKLPKSRIVSLWGSVVTRISAYNNGDKNALNGWDWFSSAWQMVSPIEAATRSIFSPIADVIANRTWYGGEIESRTLEQMYEAKDRYDESTSSIAISIGQLLKVSPKKIHYLLDQYSGVIGDIILPLTTNKAEQNMFESRFIVDPLYTNDISTKYYDLKDELTFAKNAKDLSATMVLKYMNKCDESLAGLYQLKRDVQNFESLTSEERKAVENTLIEMGYDIAGADTLKDKQKREITDIIQALLNGSLASLTENAEIFEQIVIDNDFASKFSSFIYSDMYKNFDEGKQNYAYNKAMNYYYAVYEASMKGVKVSPKMSLYDAIGGNETALYLAEISRIESDKDRNGNTITGSRKTKVHKYIQSLNLSAVQKNILMYLAGYKPTDIGQGAVRKYLREQGYTAEEIKELWKD